MIKWHLFWKSLKQLFFSSLISCFILLGSSVNSYNIQQVWLDSSPSWGDPNYQLTFLKWWGLMTSFVWYSKGVTAIYDNVLFWRTPNWLPYLYYNSYVWSKQWFFNWYSVCDPLTWLDSVPMSNCVDYTIWEDTDIFVSFLKVASL